MTTDKLTMRALKQHDNIHPTFKAPPQATTTSSKEGQETRKVSVQKQEHAGILRKRSRLTSFRSDGDSSNSHAMPSKGLSIFRLVAATRAWQRMAKKHNVKKEEKVIPVKLENTYKMKPDDDKRFSKERVERCLDTLLEAKLDNVEYSPEKCRYLTQDLSGMIKSRIKAMNFPRYKLVCNVVIMENKGQGTEIASRCVWDSASDAFATSTYRNETLVVVANVHAVYFE